MITIIKKLSLILSKEQMRKIGFIVFLMLIGAVLETASVSLVVPLMTTLVEEDFIHSNEMVSSICVALGITEAKDFILLVIVALVIMFVFKNVFLFFQYNIQIQFICNNRMATQKKLFQTYLNRPYEFFLNASSGEIMQVVKTDTVGTFSVLSTVMNFCTEMIVSIALVIAIVVVDPVMAVIVALILLVAMSIIYIVVKPTLKKAGYSFQYNNAHANMWILQAIAGAKEMKVANKEAFFMEQYTSYVGKAVKAEKTSSVLANAPRLIIESVTISGLLLFFALMLGSGREVSELLPQLAAFAVAAVRLLPSANRMSVALNSMTYLEAQLDKTIENLRVSEEYKKDDEKKSLKHEKKDVEVTLEKECGLYGITYSYPNADKNVLECANMIIPVGKSVGIIGPSGAGKTTAVDILLGLLDMQNGEVRSDDRAITENYESWLKHLSYIPQRIYMLDDNIRANVAFGYSKEEIDDEQVWKVLEDAQMADFVRSLPDGLDTEIGEDGMRLSGGQRQRIGIARALYSDPELLIFDEATSALDNETESAIMEAVNGLHGKKTMIIIAHRLTTIKECDIIYRVADGKITQVAKEDYISEE